MREGPWGSSALPPAVTPVLLKQPRTPHPTGSHPPGAPESLAVPRRVLGSWSWGRDLRQGSAPLPQEPPQRRRMLWMIFGSEKRLADPPQFSLRGFVPALHQPPLKPLKEKPKENLAVSSVPWLCTHWPFRKPSSRKGINELYLHSPPLRNTLRSLGGGSFLSGPFACSVTSPAKHKCESWVKQLKKSCHLIVYLHTSATSATSADRLSTAMGHFTEMPQNFKMLELEN